MSPSHITVPAVRQSVENVIHDGAGVEVFRVGMSDVTLTEPDGSMSTRKISDYFPTVDGVSISGAMLLGTDPIMLVVCASCRCPPTSLFNQEQPSHGLCTALNAVYCIDCAAPLCPRHRRWVAEEWRCSRCTKRFRRRMFIRRLFFAEVED